MRRYVDAAVTLAAGMLLCAPLPAGAVKAWPGLLKGRLQSGGEIEYRMYGDEYAHAAVSADGYVLAEGVSGLVKTELFDAGEFRARSAMRAPKKRLLSADFPTTGDLKGIIILAEFADNEFAEGHDAALFHDKMNAEGYSGYGSTGSARDYFIDQSSGLFTPEFDVVGPVKLSRSMMYYGANDRNGQDSNPARMVKEACELAKDNHDVDFSRYDFDGDGTVDFVYIIYAGYAESYGASSNTIWPHASQITLHGESCELDGKRIDRYACSSELKFVSGDIVEGIGTFCHEFGHVLGLPDMYDTRNAGNTQLGAWDVMDQGSYNNDSHTPPAYSAFERASLGWLELKELDTPADRVELPELTSSNVAYRVSTPVEGEYFTVENRQQRGWDLHQPGRGMMIIHVAYDRSAWEGNFVNSGIISRYDLVEADGRQGAGSYEGDLFPYGDVDSFTDYSSPSSLTWNGTMTEKGISMIRDEEGLITFRFMRDRLARPQGLEVVDFGDEWVEMSWAPVEGAGHYRLNVEEVLTPELNPVLLGEDFSGFADGGYPNADYTDLSESLDGHTGVSGWRGTEIYSAGGKVQLGRYGASGVLTSPAIDMPAGLDSITVALKVVSYPGKSVNYSLRLTDAASGAEVAVMNDKANKTEKEVIWRVGALPASVRLEVTTSNERLYLGALRVLKDVVAADEAWSLGPRAWSISDIEETRCRVEGLAAERTYLFTVEATAFDGMHGSVLSDMVSVTTRTSGVGDIPAAGRTVKDTFVYDMLGRPVSADTRGPRIVVTVYSDGRRETKKVID